MTLIDYKFMYEDLLTQYEQLQKKAHKWRKAKKRWKNKYIKLSCCLANKTAEVADELYD